MVYKKNVIHHQNVRMILWINLCRWMAKKLVSKENQIIFEKHVLEYFVKFNICLFLVKMWIKTGDVWNIKNFFVIWYYYTIYVRTLHSGIISPTKHDFFKVIDDLMTLSKNEILVTSCFRIFHTIQKSHCKNIFLWNTASIIYSNIFIK